MTLALAVAPEGPSPAWAQSLRVTRVDLELLPERTWRLPPDPTVMVRGALGSALLELACTQPEPACLGCPERQGCPVPKWYDPGRVGSGAARPVLVRVAAPGGAWVEAQRPLRVELWALGPIPRHSLLVEAVERMARLGLGPARVKHTVQRLTAHGHGAPARVLEQGHECGRWPEPGHLGQHLAVPEQPTGAELHLITPATWTGVGPAAPPTPADLVRAAVGRVRQLAREQRVALDRWWPDPRAQSGRWLEAEWVSGARFSQRQHARVDLSGWTGRLELGPEVALFADALAAAEVLGLGKATSCGRGQVRVVWR